MISTATYARMPAYDNSASTQIQIWFRPVLMTWMIRPAWMTMDRIQKPMQISANKSRQEYARPLRAH